MLVHAVVVAGDGSRADVDTRADDGVAKIVEVVGLGSFAESHLLGLDKVADVRAFADAALGAEMSVGTEDRSIAYFGAVEDAAIAHGDFVAESRLLDDGVGADAALGADLCRSQQLYIGFDDGVRTNRNGGVDDTGFRAEDSDALRHETLRRLHAHSCVEVHHLGDGVGTENLVDALGLDGDDAFAVGDQHGGYVGEVELTVRVIGREGIELVEEGFRLETIDAGVDLGRIQLVGAERLLLDDGSHFRLAGGGTQHAAIAGGIVGNSGQDGHSRMFVEVKFTDRGDGLRPDQRHVAR